VLFLVIFVLVSTVFCIVCTFLYCPFMYVFLLVLSVLPPSDNLISASSSSNNSSNNNNNNNNVCGNNRQTMTYLNKHTHDWRQKLSKCAQRTCYSVFQTAQEGKKTFVECK
jgi:hypothetical protein